MRSLVLLLVLSCGGVAPRPIAFKAWRLCVECGPACPPTHQLETWPVVDGGTQEVCAPW